MQPTRNSVIERPADLTVEWGTEVRTLIRDFGVGGVRLRARTISLRWWKCRRTSFKEASIASVPELQNRT